MRLPWRFSALSEQKSVYLRKYTVRYDNELLEYAVAVAIRY